MDREKEREQEQYSNMVNHNTILLSFEGWIKYIEGFSRGLQTTKSVDSSSVMDVVGEIMEYMTTLRKDIITILTHCEDVMEENDSLMAKLAELQPKPLIEQKENVPEVISTNEEEQ